MQAHEPHKAVTNPGREYGLRVMILFGLLNTLPFPLSILLDIFGNTIGALSQVLPLGFELPPMFGFVDGMLRGHVIDLLASPVAALLGVPERIAYLGPESPAMLVWFMLTFLVALSGGAAWLKLWPRPSYASLRAWSHLWFRWFLASMMLRYGAMKVFDSQFGEPMAQDLLTPTGEHSRMRLLWLVFAASPGFEVFSGMVEMVGSLLLFHRRTAFAGLLLLFGALAQIVCLNWLCGINVKFVSGWLFCVNVALVVPYFPRIAACLGGQESFPSPNLSVLPFAKNPERLRRIGWVLATAYLFAFHLTALRQGRFTQARFPTQWFHGAWEVVELEKNGQAVSSHDLQRWRHLTFDSFQRFSVTKSQGERTGWIYQYDQVGKGLEVKALGRPPSSENQAQWKNWKVLPGSAGPETMDLSGSIGDEQYRVRAKWMDFRLLGE